MKKNTWFRRNRWLLGGLLLAGLALAIVLVVWAAQAHQYQLTLAHYIATTPKTITIPSPGGGGTTVPNPTYSLPTDTSGPGTWGWSGWAIRLLAIFAPVLLGCFLHWREHRPPTMRIHKEHLDHATNKLAEAIGENQQLPQGVFDAYSRLRDLEEKRHPPV
ncbi:MAG TPA: hypothetical protein VKT82_05515 [Ktedonobacterales bacterium]|nr:hypothetical protein [Ktedonobacterales bacterium]